MSATLMEHTSRETPEQRTGRLLAQYRQRGGQHERDIARSAAIHTTRLRQFEAGGALPSRLTLGALSFALGLAEDEAIRLHCAAGYLPDDDTLIDLAWLLSAECVSERTREQLRRGIAEARTRCERRAS